MKKCDKLYIGFRKFVPKDKLINFDNEYFKKKTRTYKFMIPFILKYINIKKLNYQLPLLEKEDVEIIKFFNSYVNRHPSWVDEVKSIPSTHNQNFLFKD